jgi:hypothetical protein
MKVTRKIRHLKEQIAVMEKERSERKPRKSRSTIELALETVERQQQEVGEALQRAAADGCARTEAPDGSTANPTRVEDDFALLFEGGID